MQLQLSLYIVKGRDPCNLKIRKINWSKHTVDIIEQRYTLKTYENCIEILNNYKGKVDIFDNKYINDITESVAESLLSTSLELCPKSRKKELLVNRFGVEVSDCETKQTERIL